MPIDRSEQYKSKWYQRTAEIESMVLNGMTIEERYQKETDFVLDSIGFGKDFIFKKGEKNLDIASGIGGHADVLRNKTEVDIEARDLSETLIQSAQTREISQISNDIRARINFALGDMGNIAPSLPEDEKYKLITILGGSFMYLPSKEAHEKALKDYFDLLAPGGKIAIQFRERKRPMGSPEEQEWMERLKVRYRTQKADGPNGKFGLYAEKGQELGILETTDKKDGEYAFKIPPADIAALKLDEDGKYYDSDGIVHDAFIKVYFDENGHEESLGPTYIIDYMSLSAFPVLKDMMEKAGFKNIVLRESPLSPGGSTVMCAVVGEKQ